jgi:hypothetical protein
MGYFYNDSNGIIVNSWFLNIETFLVGVLQPLVLDFGKRMGFSSLKGRL